jgi:hypothetical protein
VVLSGGDAFYSGWRLVAPLLPAALSAVALGVATLDGRWRRGMGVGLAVALAGTLATAALRPGICAASAGACGWDEARRWPTTLQNYAWDITNAAEDGEVGTALRRAFPPDVTVGQSDYLRLGMWVDGPFMDLSGLVNASLAHRPHAASSVMLADAAAVLEAHPDVYFWAAPWTLTWSRVGYRLTDPDANEVFFRLPTDRNALAALDREYTIGAIRLSDGRRLHVLIARRALPRMRASSEVEVVTE